MSRKKELSSETANQILAKRLQFLLKERNVNQSQLANGIEVQRQTTSNYVNGQSVPDAYTLEKLARYLGVTTDYLVGRSDIPAPTMDAELICQRTGLTPIALEKLCNLDGIRLSILNALLSSESFVNSYLYKIADVETFRTIADETLENLEYDAKDFDSIEEARKQVVRDYKNLRLALFDLSEESTNMLDSLFRTRAVSKALEDKEAELSKLYGDLARKTMQDQDEK